MDEPPRDASRTPRWVMVSAVVALVVVVLLVVVVVVGGGEHGPGRHAAGSNSATPAGIAHSR